MDRIVYLNGDFIRWDQATIHLMSHSVGRGSAIFEVLSLHDTEAGPAVFRADAHVNRLFRTAALLETTLPFSKESLQEAILELARRNGLRKGLIKIICFYPDIVSGILPPQKPMEVSLFVFDPSQDLGGGPSYLEGNVSLCLSRWRKLDPETVPVEAKVAANYLNGMMAQVEARKRGVDKAIMLDTQGFLAEGGTECIFLVKEGRIMTPCLGTILESVTRNSLLEIAGSLGLTTTEGRLHPKLLREAEEIFLSSTPYKVMPVREIEGKIAGEVPGPVTRRLSAKMDEILSGRDERFSGWMFKVNKP